MLTRARGQMRPRLSWWWIIIAVLMSLPWLRRSNSARAVVSLTSLRRNLPRVGWLRRTHILWWKSWKQWRIRKFLSESLSKFLLVIWMKGVSFWILSDLGIGNSWNWRGSLSWGRSWSGCVQRWRRFGSFENWLGRILRRRRWILGTNVFFEILTKVFRLCFWECKDQFLMHLMSRNYQ